MWPEITAKQEIKRADLALPRTRIHDGIHANRNHLGIARQEFFALHLVSNHLLRADRFPIRRIKGEHQVLLAAVLGQSKLLSHAANQDRNIEIWG